MDEEKLRLHLMVAAMEDEDGSEPLSPALEDALVVSVLNEIRTQRALHRRRWWVGGSVGAALALAAGLAILVGGHPTPGPAPALPRYALRVSGNVKRLGATGSASDRQQVTQLSPDSELSVSLRPTQAAAGPLKVVAFLRKDGALRRWEVEPAALPDGTLRLQAPIRELPDLGREPGRWELIFALGNDPRADGPDVILLDRALRNYPDQPTGETSVGPWQVLWHTISLVPRT